MAQLIDIQRVSFGPKYMSARIRIADSAPLMTNEDLIGTTLVYNTVPHIIEHACTGDSGTTFKEAMPSTEIAHLLEHVTVELMSQAGEDGEISCGRTRAVTGEYRTYEIQLICPDDVLVAGALSSAVWILNWAYSGGGDPEPNIEGIIEGLRTLVKVATNMGEAHTEDDASQDEAETQDQEAQEYEAQDQVDEADVKDQDSESLEDEAVEPQESTDLSEAELSSNEDSE